MMDDDLQGHVTDLAQSFANGKKGNGQISRLDERCQTGATMAAKKAGGWLGGTQVS